MSALQTPAATVTSDSSASAATPKNPRAAAFHRIFEKVCEQLNFNERERTWFRQLLKEELKDSA